jgi:hypothetical protein
MQKNLETIVREQWFNRIPTLRRRFYPIGGAIPTAAAAAKSTALGIVLTQFFWVEPWVGLTSHGPQTIVRLKLEMPDYAD